jgi:hypothetical protein
MTRPHTPPPDIDAACDAARGHPASLGLLAIRAAEAEAEKRAGRRIAALVIGAGVAVAAILAATAAWPQMTRMWIEPGDVDCFAYVAIHNRIGTYNAVERLQTEAGEVWVRYRTTPPHKPGDPDSADFVSVEHLPDGVIAEPMEMQIMERETGRICLVRWLGG